MTKEQIIALIEREHLLSLNHLQELVQKNGDIASKAQALGGLYALDNILAKIKEAGEAPRELAEAVEGVSITYTVNSKPKMRLLHALHKAEEVLKDG